MAIVMGALGLAISNMGGPATQVAAAQVASGLSLARQYAVAKNLETRFIIFNLDGADGTGLPPESWRYWTVIQRNRHAGSWTMLKEWEKLPAGVVFLNVAQMNYSVIAGDPIGAKPGEIVSPVFAGASPGTEYKFMESFINGLKCSAGSNSFTLGKTPAVGFKGVGEGVRGDGSSFGSGSSTSVNQQEAAIRVVPGAVTLDGKQIIIKATNNYYYVEIDKRGRVRVRPPESYRQ
ncbi:MAG: hypothetical protein RIQ71_1466 [Verrucomicrobiota bacterium]